MYESIIAELNNDILRADEIILDLEWRNKVVNRIAENEVSDLEWIENDSLIPSFTSFPDFNISKERYELLKQKSDLNDSTRILNIQIADFYHKFTIDINTKNSELNESFYSDISYWRENTIWFGTYIRDNDRTELLKYIKENPLFINRILWKRILLRGFEREIKKYSLEAEQLKDKIKLYLNK